MTSRSLFLDSIKKEKQRLSRMTKKVDDLDYIQTLTYRIELINLLIVSLQGFKSRNSLKNLKHRAKF